MKKHSQKRLYFVALSGLFVCILCIGRAFAEPMPIGINVRSEVTAFLSIEADPGINYEWSLYSKAHVYLRNFSNGQLDQDLFYMDSPPVSDSIKGAECEITESDIWACCDIELSVPEKDFMAEAYPMHTGTFRVQGSGTIKITLDYNMIQEEQKEGYGDGLHKTGISLIFSRYSGQDFQFLDGDEEEFFVDDFLDPFLGETIRTYDGTLSISLDFNEGDEGSFRIEAGSFAEAITLFYNDIPGKVTGQVTDFATGAPIENAEVCVGGNSYRDQTDSNGYYSIEGIPVGEYQICASHPDYETHREAIQIIVDLTIEKNFELSSADLYVDLSVSSSDVVVEPKISSGDTSFGFIKLTASVKNIGQRGAENVNVSFYRVTETGKELIGIVPTPRIAAGDSVSVEENMDAANLVTSYIIVEADNDEDKNQDNNIAVKQIDGLELLGDFECHLPSSGTCVPTAQAEVMDYLKIYSPGCGWFDCLYNFFCHWGDDIMFCSSCEEMKSGKDTSGLCLYLSTLRWIKENGPGFYLDSGFWADWEAIKSCINRGFPVIAELPGHVTPIIGYWEYDGSKYALSCGGNGKLFRELDETPPFRHDHIGSPAAYRCRSWSHNDSCVLSG